MAKRALDVYTEWRGGTCRVKWWTGGYHESGRKQFASQGGFEDEDTAYQHGLDQMHDIRHGVHVSKQDGATSVSEWSDTWLASLSLAHLSIRNYKSAIKMHVKPYFRDKTVGQLTIMDYRAFKKHLGATVGDKHARQILMIFGLVMADAVKAGLRKDSPVEASSRRGKYKKKPRERKKDMQVDAVQQLAANAQLRWGNAGHVFFWTMAMTGMRPGELFGLTREYCYPNWPASDPRTDADSAEERAEDVLRYGKDEGLMPAIRVQRQVQYEEGKLGFYPPKYESHRTLVIPDFLADALEALLASHDSEWVFPGIEGGCLAQLSFDRYYWRPIADGAAANDSPYAKRPYPAISAVPAFAEKRMYLIRHGHKAWLDEDGHSRYAVETRMGHEVQGVEGTYSNLTVPMEQSFRDALQKRWVGLGVPAWEPGELVGFERRPTIASLVRASMDAGLAGEALLAAVQQVRPGTSEATVSRTALKYRAALRERPDVSHPFPS